MKYNYVYLIINKCNLKMYIGKHSTNNMDDNYMGSGVELRKAIKKYGRENFEKIILKQCDSEKEASIAEEQYILISDAHKKDQFYNIKSSNEGARQREGIDAMPVNEDGKKYSKKTGRVTGRPVTRTFPKDWDNTYKSYKDGYLKAKDVQKMYDIPKSTFYYMLKQYEGECSTK